MDGLQWTESTAPTPPIFPQRSVHPATSRPRPSTDRERGDLGASVHRGDLPDGQPRQLLQLRRQRPRQQPRRLVPELGQPVQHARQLAHRERELAEDGDELVAQLQVGHHPCREGAVGGGGCHVMMVRLARSGTVVAEAADLTWSAESTGVGFFCKCLWRSSDRVTPPPHTSVEMLARYINESYSSHRQELISLDVDTHNRSIVNEEPVKSIGVMLNVDIHICKI